MQKITIPYKQFKNDMFFEAVQYINSRPLPFKVSYQLKKIADELQQRLNEVHKAWTELRAAHPAPAEDAHEDEKAAYQEKWDAARAEFDKKTVVLERYPILVSDLPGSIELSASYIALLEPFFYERALTPEEEVGQGGHVVPFPSA